SLIRGIVRAQRVAVQEQHAASVQIDDRAVLEQPHAGFFAEAFADQKIAIAMYQGARRAGGRQVAHGSDRAAFVGIGIVVSDPRFEQVPEDVERLRVLRLFDEKAQELIRDLRMRSVEMEVGDEKGAHGSRAWGSGRGAWVRRKWLGAVGSASWCSGPSPRPHAPSPFTEFPSSRSRSA